MLRELKKFPVYARIGVAIVLWVTLREADEMVRNGSAERISRRGFALRLTGHKFTGAAGQARDLSCRMDERVMVANADGERRARGIVAGWAVNHAGLCPKITMRRSEIPESQVVST
jgi:hypothetical protein